MEEGITLTLDEHTLPLTVDLLRKTHDMGVRPAGVDDVEWTDAVPSEARSGVRNLTKKLVEDHPDVDDDEYPDDDEFGTADLDGAITDLETAVENDEDPWVEVSMTPVQSVTVYKFYENWRVLIVDEDEYHGSEKEMGLDTPEAARIGYICGLFDGAAQSRSTDSDEENPDGETVHREA